MTFIKNVLLSIYQYIQHILSQVYRWNSIDDKQLRSELEEKDKEIERLQSENRDLIQQINHLKIQKLCNSLTIVLILSMEF